MRLFVRHTFPSIAAVHLFLVGAPIVAQSVPASTTGGDEWAGFQIGVQSGYGQGRADATLSDPTATHEHSAFGRTDGGLDLAYNRALGSHLALGASGDVAFPYFYEDGIVLSGRMTPATGVTERVDFISTVRGRLGYAANRWLIYGTTGFAPTQTRFADSSGSTADRSTVPRLTAGWVLGAGVEFAIARGWTARVEYLYDRFGGATAVFPSGTRATLTGDVHSVRLGLNRSFALPGHRPVIHEENTESVDGGPTASARWNLHVQDTFIEQGYFRFRSPYEGTNSLTGASQAKNTESATAFLDVRLWGGADLYVNPEIDQGFGLNDTHGVAAFPNGEAQKASFPMPRFVPDRIVLRQTFGLGGAQEQTADGPNQLAGKSDISRVTLAMGRLAVTDYFDDNTFANDPRTNFLNWNIYGAGAYDWTMDQLSWTWGALVDLNEKDWALRGGYFLLPTVSSTNSFDMHIPGRGEYALEWEQRYALASRPGTIRVFGWVNHGTMGSYAAALAMPVSTPNYPDITQTRQVRTNPGIVIDAEQAITNDVGLFSRASWSPGLDEILGGTDCSRSISLGGAVRGRAWRRPNDKLGVAAVVGGLSSVARAYFGAGGLGILIGDGRLNYRDETAREAYYSYAFATWLTLSLDYQFVVNPGYNADRGPASIYALRLRTTF